MIEWVKAAKKVEDPRGYYVRIKCMFTLTFCVFRIFDFRLQARRRPANNSCQIFFQGRMLSGMKLSKFYNTIDVSQKKKEIDQDPPDVEEFAAMRQELGEIQKKLSDIEAVERAAGGSKKNQKKP